MQQAQESAAETEAQCQRRLWLVAERCIVQLQLVERIAKFGVVGAVDRVQAREHHRLRVAVAAEGLGGALALRRDRVADARLTHVLDSRDQIADLADAEPLGRHGLWRDHADLEQLVDGSRRHHLDALSGRDVTVDDADVGDDTAIRVIDRVEDHRPGRLVCVADRGGDLPDDLLQQLVHADTRLRRDEQDVVGRAADDVGELRRVLLRLRGGQVDLVQHRNDRQVVLEGEVEIREGLRLNALGSVDQEDGPFAGGQRARDLVGEVDVPGGVDHVQDIRLPVL